MNALQSALTLPQAAIVARAPFQLVRCHCPTCLRLDAQYPGQGYQLTFAPYRFERRAA
jgi:hypothetical protein